MQKDLNFRESMRGMMSFAMNIKKASVCNHGDNLRNHFYGQCWATKAAAESSKLIDEFCTHVISTMNDDFAFECIVINSFLQTI